MYWQTITIKVAWCGGQDIHEEVDQQAIDKVQVNDFNANSLSWGIFKQSKRVTEAPSEHLCVVLAEYSLKKMGLVE